MGTGWERVMRGPQSRTHLHTVSPFTTPSRDGVLSLSVTLIHHGIPVPLQHTSPRLVLLVALAAARRSSPSFCVPARWVRERGTGPPKQLLGEASSRKLQNQTQGRIWLTRWPYAPDRCVPGAQEGETAVWASKTPAPMALTTG